MTDDAVPPPPEPTPAAPGDGHDPGDGLAPGDATVRTDPPDPHLVAAVRELEAHAAEQGWDQPARLYALVPTADLVAREPELAQLLGLDAETPAGLTPVEQDPVPGDRPLEDVLEAVMWPAEVAGAAAVVERLVLPPSADSAIPEDPAEAQAYAESHPDREEVRVVAAAMRDGERFAALRLRSHDDALAVLEDRDLVPGLLELLARTLEQ
jgi:hypothetical protein